MLTDILVIHNLYVRQLSEDLSLQLFPEEVITKG